MDVEEALGKVGGYRRFHLAAFVLISFCLFFNLVAQGIGIVFIGFTWPHYCKVPEGAHVNETIPVNADGSDLEQCSMYANTSDVINSNVTTSCVDGWTHMPSGGEHTIVMEWNLVCEYNYLAEISQVLYQAGAMVGELTASVMTDAVGRKWIHVFSYVGVAAFGTGLAFTQSFIVFAIIRPLIAICVVASVISGLTQLMEMFDSEHRAFVGIGCEFLWSVGYMYTALLAYLIRDWRKLQLVLSLTSLLGLLNIFIPESPMWLVANNRDDEAEEALQKMARYNGVKVKQHLLDSSGTSKSDIKQQLAKGNAVNFEENGQANNNAGINSDLSIQHKPKKKETVLDCFRDPLLRKYSIISILLWFANNIVYYFLVLSAPSLGGDIYMSFFLGGLVEIPAFALCYFVVGYGRRISTCVFHILAGIALGVISFIPENTAGGTDLQALKTAVFLFGKFSITASFTIIILYTKELFPTNLRGTSFGVCNFLGRIGNMAAPFAAYVIKSMPWVPNIILAVICLAVALLCLLLPETKDWPLPQSIEDVYLYNRGGHRLRRQTLVNAQTVVEDRESSI